MKRKYLFTLEMEIDDKSDVNGRDDERHLAHILRRCEKDIKNGITSRKNGDEESWISERWTLIERTGHEKRAGEGTED